MDRIVEGNTFLHSSVSSGNSNIDFSHVRNFFQNISENHMTL